MSKEKRATLLRVLVAVIHTGALGRMPAHAAPAHHEGQAGAPTLQENGSPVILSGETFDRFDNADPYVQHFGDLIVIEEPWFESSFPTW